MRRSGARARTALAAVIAAGSFASALAAGAFGHDSLSPAGAPHRWLPKEDWVYRHWIPFDEQTLKARLGLTGRQLEGYLYNDHRSLDQLAAARGIPLAQLEDELLQPWDGVADEARLAILRDRTHRILTQSHLAQHMFFHTYHGIDARAHAQALFGLSPRAYWRLRVRGYSGRRIAKVGEVSTKRVRTGMKRLFDEDLAEGIRLKVALPLQNERMYDRRIRQLACWVDRPLPTFDPLAFYAHEDEIHGTDHPRGYPSTPEQLLQDSARVERYRSTLPGSCHERPVAWSPGAPAAAPAREERVERAAAPRVMLCDLGCR